MPATFLVTSGFTLDLFGGPAGTRSVIYRACIHILSPPKREEMWELGFLCFAGNLGPHQGGHSGTTCCIGHMSYAYVTTYTLNQAT